MEDRSVLTEEVLNQMIIEWEQLAERFYHHIQRSTCFDHSQLIYQLRMHQRQQRNIISGACDEKSAAMAAFERASVLPPALMERLRGMTEAFVSETKEQLSVWDGQLDEVFKRFIGQIDKVPQLVESRCMSADFILKTTAEKVRLTLELWRQNAQLHALWKRYHEKLEEQQQQQEDANSHHIRAVQEHEDNTNIARVLFPPRTSTDSVDVSVQQLHSTSATAASRFDERLLVRAASSARQFHSQRTMHPRQPSPQRHARVTVEPVIAVPQQRSADNSAPVSHRSHDTYDADQERSHTAETQARLRARRSQIAELQARIQELHSSRQATRAARETATPATQA